VTALKLDDMGLLPAVAQDARTGRVLMVAFMNAEALRLTIDTGEAHFWSRSRRELWRKGEVSGNVLRVVEVRVDCDADAVLLRCDPAGPTCHTGRPSCFFRTPDGAEVAPPDGASASIVERLYQVVLERKAQPGRRSYVRSLLDGGTAAIAAKIREEAAELSAALEAETDERVAAETADLLFHALVALGARAVPPEAVWAELRRRFGMSGLDEKASRPT
jgi:phosphoribosyl-ATP pyrophosphohydrolase/phosphoribosyl-AMP cyclohydrolase